MKSEVADRLILQPRPLPRSGKAAIGLLVLLGLIALPSGWALMAPPRGNNPLGMPLGLLKGTPFSSYFIPGLILFGLFGVGSLAAALVGLLRHWSAPYLTFAVGVGQMIWISVEWLLLPYFHPLQPTMFTYGGAMALLSYFWRRADRRAA